MMCSVPVEVSGKRLTSFMTKLKQLVDPRDNRGKRHELAFVLGSVILAIMSGRSYASSIYRFIKNRIKWLHFNPTTTQQSHQAGGLFIIQLKDNQPTWFEQMSQEAAEARPLGTFSR